MDRSTNEILQEKDETDSVYNKKDDPEKMLQVNNQYMEKFKVVQQALKENFIRYRKQLVRNKRNKKRKDLIEAMGNFSPHISHQLRNPLGSVELFASILKKELKGDSLKENLVNNIFISISIMN